MIFFHSRSLILWLVIRGHADLLFINLTVARRKLNVNLNKPKDRKINVFFEVINENSVISKVIKEEELCPNKSCVLRIVSRKQGIPVLLELLVLCLKGTVQKACRPNVAIPGLSGNLEPLSISSKLFTCEKVQDKEEAV